MTGKYLINKQHFFDNSLSFFFSRHLSHTNSNSFFPNINNEGRDYDEISYTTYYT